MYHLTQNGKYYWLRLIMENTTEKVMVQDLT